MSVWGFVSYGSMHDSSLLMCIQISKRQRDEVQGFPLSNQQCGKNESIKVSKGEHSVVTSTVLALRASRILSGTLT